MISFLRIQNLRSLVYNMKYLLLLLSFNLFAGEIPCADTTDEINSFNLTVTVPFEREGNEPMLITDYHPYVGINVYINNTHYDFNNFTVTGAQMSIKVWTRCSLNHVYVTLVDTESRQSIPSNEVIIDYTAPKTGVVECTL